MARTSHYLSPLLTTSIPRCHAVFDCETRTVRKHGRMAHGWVCGASAYGELSRDGYWGAERAQYLSTPEHLWGQLLDGRPIVDHLVIWAHNLSFDMRVSEALRWLPVHGYSLEAIVLEKTAAWAAFVKGRAKVTLCDLHSWLPVPLAKLTADLGGSRPAFNYRKADDAELIERCVEDVQVTTTAVGLMLEWLHRENAGPFRPTGSGQSHSMWRRRFLQSKVVLIHDDEQALERERLAMWAGRAEAWKWGEVKGPLYEHDLSLAYCRVAAYNAVPVKLSGRGGRITVQTYQAKVRSGAMLCDVNVTTESEVAPVGHDGRMWWPVGTYKTTLWNPEITALLDSGAEVEIVRHWHYRTAPVLAPMAVYLSELLDGPPGTVHPVIARLVKHWARTLVGRCALRYREWDDFGTVGAMGLSLSTMHDIDTGDTAELLHVGHRIMELADMAEADSSVPQITGWVMSKARANLWGIMQVAGLDNLAYVDTDCVIVNQDGDRRLTQWAPDDRELVLTHKATYGSATVYGPRNIVLGEQRRLSGIPKAAILRGELHFDGDVWAGLRTSLESGYPSQVTVTPRTFDVEDVDPRRHRTKGGLTQPYREGGNETT